MERRPQDQENLRSYLLGLLPQEAQTPLEERLLTDNALYEELLIVENELIDEYLAGELTAQERARFESHFTNAPERRRQVRFAGALGRYVAGKHRVVGAEPAEPSAKAERGTDSPERNRRFFSWPLVPKPAPAFSLSAVLILVVAATFWVLISRRAGHEPGNVYAVTLTPGLVRESGEMKKIALPAEADTLRLRLELSDVEHGAYKAELRTAEGGALYTSDLLQSQATGATAVVETDVPSKLLTTGDFKLKLYGHDTGGGGEVVATYPFRINVRR